MGSNDKPGKEEGERISKSTSKHEHFRLLLQLDISRGLGNNPAADLEEVVAPHPTPVFSPWGELGKRSAGTKAKPRLLHSYN